MTCEIALVAAGRVNSLSGTSGHKPQAPRASLRSFLWVLGSFGGQTQNGIELSGGNRRLSGVGAWSDS